MEAMSNTHRYTFLTSFQSFVFCPQNLLVLNHLSHSHFSVIAYSQQVEDLLESSDDSVNTKGETDIRFRNKVIPAIINSSQELVCCKDMGIATSEAYIQSTSRSLYISHKSEQDALDIVGDVKNLESESECAPNGSCLVASLEYDSNNTHDYEDRKDAEQELTQLQNGVTGSIVIKLLSSASITHT